MKTIEITVSSQGEARLQTKGFTGSSCREASRLLEQALGDVQSDTPTAEMCQDVPETRHVRQQG
jgi:hypothetical protein